MKMLALIALMFMTVPAGAWQFRDIPLKTSTVLAAHFNEGTGATSIAASGDVLTFTGTAGWASGKFGAGIFVPSGTNAVCPPNKTLPYGNGAWVHMWARSDGSAAAYMSLYSFSPSDGQGSTEIDWRYGNADRIDISERYSGSWANAGLSVPDLRNGRWHMIDLIRGATTLNYWDLYVDAVFRGRFTNGKSFAFTASNSTVAIGNYLGCAYAYAQGAGGTIDDMFHVVIPIPSPCISSTIKNLYNDGLGRHSNAR